ncbi:Choline kinase [Rubellimicrobium mesophilum DSM 19309]|uniref:Choline kinase n=1 Tax=Rubellimicrobium mesophilum DSM 19309 TaxID=442562 RepID=A0A017HQR5_9RHOB|nr:phosphotransferase [Rubellimicrobium mesophilum]EYD76069.1 Choline kinase [Rubellimicrobium mesophilum DSM 19309]
MDLAPAPDRIAALPCWTGRPRAAPLPGGLSNEIWKVEDEAGAHVVRFGRDYPCHHVSRAREQMTTRAAHAAGFAPAVEWTAEGVMVTAFVTSRTWDAAEVRANPQRLATLLRDFHQKMPEEVSGPPYLFSPFLMARDYARTLAAGNSPHLPQVPRLLALTRALERTQPPLHLVFGHNDLLPANLLDDGSRLWLIDYEYAGFASPLFDLAGAASNAGMDKAQSDALLTAYFGQPPDEPLRRAFDAMACASLLRESMWAMASAIHLSAPGADYDAYAAENLAKLDEALDAFQSRHGRLE